VDEADAVQFCCNAIELAGRVFMNNASQDLQKRLRRAGFIPVIAPMSEFLKSGGAAKCLTLNLAERRLAA
jgi:N-dimethylarginine dimethylaminohydrolase